MCDDRRYHTDVPEDHSEIVESRFAATEPTRPGLGLIALATAIVIGLVIVALSARRWGLPEFVGLAIPWIMVFGLMLAGSIVGRRQRDIRRKIQEASDLIQLDSWVAAGEILEGVMQRQIRSRTHRGQAFLLGASLLERERDYAAAAQIYETMSLRRIGDPLQLQQAAISLAAAKLRTSELTDAVALIGRLERVEMPQPMRAACDLVRLFQQVSMGHFEDAVGNIDERLEAFRRQLSTQAGYAYGLLATAMHYLGKAEDAGRLWRNATLLIRPERLMESFDLLRIVSKEYAATERPL